MLYLRTHAYTMAKILGKTYTEPPKPVLGGICSKIHGGPLAAKRTIHGSHSWSGGTIYGNKICHRWSGGTSCGGGPLAA